MKGKICLLLYIIACHSCVNEKTHVNQIMDEISIYDNQAKDTSSSIDIDNKKSLYETIGYCDSGEIYAYLIDDDSNGTNLRKKPNGEIIYVLKTQNGNVEFSLSESKDSWLKITKIDTYDDAIEPIPDECWIHGPLIGAQLRNYDGQPIALYKTPDATQIAFTIYEQDVILSFNTMCGSDWVQVNHRGELGWIQSEWLCGNPVTTCP